jgi:ubiquitin C-terminal hydrolase
MDDDIYRSNITVKGLVGLSNLGNTCYMNSLLQALFVTPHLNYYILPPKKLFYKQFKKNIIEKIKKKKKINTTLESKESKITDKLIEIKDYESQSNNNDVTNNSIESISENIQIINEPIEIENEITNEEIKEKIMLSATYNYYLLICEVWNDNNIISPESFKRFIGTLDVIFKGNAQNDSHELLLLILNKFHDELKYEAETKFTNIPKEVMNVEFMKNNKEYLKNNTKYTAIYKSLDYIKNQALKGHSIINDIFRGLLFFEKTCNVCKTSIQTFDYFYALTVSIPDKKKSTSLDKCLKLTFEQQIINDFRCDECNKITTAKNKQYLWDTSDVLIIQLNRFINKDNTTVKNNAEINYPIFNLNLMNISSEHNINNSVYDLYAVICHRGATSGGHYYSYIKNPINNYWYKANDSSVTFIEFNDIELEIVTETGYVLFYQKR